MPKPGSPAAPLEGVRVVEIASVVLGPLAGQMLGDLGADVIKIESPYGDSNRRIGPYRNHADMASFFLSCNRNKRSVVLDLKSENGLRAARGIVAGADVLLHNHRPEAIRRLGLDYGSIRDLKPDMIYCATYGFGQRGSYAGQGAFDDSIQAASGLAALQGEMLGSPQYLPTLVADKTTAMFAVQGILAALLHRERTGEGQEVEIPMFEAMVSWLMVEHLWGLSFEPPLGGPGYPRLLAEFRKPYRCSDGAYLAVLPYMDAHWKAFCLLGGRPDLVTDPRFSDLKARSDNIAETYRVTSEIVAEKTRDEWINLLRGGNVPTMIVNGMGDLLDDPHLDAAGFWQAIEHPTEGKLTMPGPPINFGSTPASIRRPPPRLGEHSVEILREAGFEAAFIENMLIAGETCLPDQGEEGPFE